MGVKESDLLWQYNPNIKAIEKDGKFVLEMDKDTFLILSGALALSSLQPYNACIHNMIAKQLNTAYIIEKLVH